MIEANAMPKVAFCKSASIEIDLTSVLQNFPMIKLMTIRGKPGWDQPYVQFEDQWPSKGQYGNVALTKTIP
jgi:hypothetical protein